MSEMRLTDEEVSSGADCPEVTASGCGIGQKDLASKKSAGKSKSANRHTIAGGRNTAGCNFL